MANVLQFNADDDYPALVVTIDGHKYTVPPISAGTLAEIKSKFASVADGEVEDADPYIVTKQLAFMLGQPEETFAKTDMRKIASVLKWLMKQFNGEDANSGKG